MTTRNRTRLTALPLAAALALTLAGCTAEVVQDKPENTETAESSATAEAPSSSPSTTADDDAAAAAAETDDAESPSAETTSAETTTPGPVTLPTGSVWLSQVSSASNRASGGEVDVTVRGVTPTNATGQFLGCDGAADVVQYQLDGQYSTLDGGLAMRDGVPEGVVAEVVLYLDDSPVSAYRIDGTDEGVSFRILLEGADVFEVHAQAVEGECTVDDVPYLAFVDRDVTP